MARILDNLSPENQVGRQAREFFQTFRSMDVATGYFNLRGWSVFCDIVDEKINQQADFPVARVLIGMAQGSAHEEIVRAYQQDVDGETDQGASRQIARSRKAELVSLMRDQLMRGVPTAHDRAVLARLYEQVKIGAVELKVFCAQPLHGKTYIFKRIDSSNPITGLVGSSNLTYPGLTSNLELNTDVVDADGAQKLATWFEDRWTDHFALPIDEEVLAVLDDSWASPKNRDPYDVFLKVCYDLSKDVRDGLEEYSLTGRIAEELLDYQSTAVKTLARRIMTRGGTMLGDVVGLGKTLTAIAVALTLRDEHGFQPLVICPKNLQKMWEDHLEAYDLHGRVVPYSMSHTLEDLRRYPFVIVDESHTLRNEETATYKDVRDYISNNDSKALLLTATPFNIEFSDVANQLGLFIDEDVDLGLQPLTALRNKDFADSLEFGPSTLAAFRKSSEPEDWKRLMSEHLVRRTRSFIKNNYALTDESGREYLTFANDQRFYFPKRRAIPVDHQFTNDDPAKLMVDETTLQAISDLKLPRYDLHRYASPGSKAKASKDELTILDDQKRSMGHATGLVRTSFFKRLSSCGHSFISSLQRHLSRNRLFLYCIDNGLPFPIGTIDSKVLRSDTDAEASEIEMLSQPSITDPAVDYQLLVDRTPAGIRWLRPELFVGALRNDITHDNEIIEGLLERYGDWSPEGDSKLAALVELVQERHPNEKILVFTEYKDTANYLGNALKHLGVQSTAVVTGETENPTALAKRFSPESNSRLGTEVVGSSTPDDEIRVLVATDVLSEGQNLQDAHIVVNYDIPWAIILLIQRAGRVDRVGQKSDEVLVYTISHGSVEEVLDLRGRVQRRLRNNAATFGSDEAFFGDPEEVRIIMDLYNGSIEDVAHEEEVDASSLAFEIWNKAIKDNPDLEKRIASLPDLIDATRRARIDEESGIICHVQSDSGLDSFGRHTGTSLELLTGHEAIRAFEAQPGEPGLERQTNHDELVKELLHGDGPLKEHSTMAGRHRGERKIIWNRLGNRLDTELDPVLRKAMSAIYEFPLTKFATTRLQKARRRGASDQDLFEIIASLYQRDDLVISTTSDKDPIRIVSVMGVSHD